jgi:hypothetical protein
MKKLIKRILHPAVKELVKEEQFKKEVTTALKRVLKVNPEYVTSQPNGPMRRFQEKGVIHKEISGVNKDDFENYIRVFLDDIPDNIVRCHIKIEGLYYLPPKWYQTEESSSPK